MKEVLQGYVKHQSIHIDESKDYEIMFEAPHLSIYNMIQNPDFNVENASQMQY